MRISPDEALKNFTELMKEQWISLSESDTRSKIIDPIFTKCLNWEETDFSREEHSDTGFVDYVFKIGKKNVFVIEAKREGVSFKLPITFGFKRRFKVGGILATSPEIREAMRQARRYCTEKGARFGIISNGDQFVIFEAIKFGEDWDRGNVMVFYNPDDVQRNFMDFWNLISKDAVERGSLIEHLSKEVEELQFIRPVDNIHFKNERYPRNELSRYMRPIISFAFGDITDEIDVSKECYVLETEFRDLDRTLKNELSTSIEKDLNLKQIVQGPETAGIFLADFYKYAEMLGQAAPEPLILLLLGRIGSGKTTFIHRFFNVVLDEEERKKMKWFYVNFKDAPPGEQDIRSYIFKSIIQEFISKYRDLFERILKTLKMEKASPTLEDISKLFLVLKYEEFIPSLIIDNVDQHKVESPTFHERVFLEANNLTKELRTITIITLREESFYTSDIYGVFDAYNIETYRIDPPDFRRMLLARLNYVLECIHAMKELPKPPLVIQSRSQEIKEFLEIIKDTIFRRPKRSATKFISKTSGGNMRRALDLFSRFLVSGNTKVKEILDVCRREGSYTIAEHQFVKSIVLDNLRYYSEEQSYLMNVFNFDTELASSHFLKLKILKYAEERASTDSLYGRGYVSINKLLKEASEIGISPEAIEDALLKMAKYRLILLNTRSRSSLENASHFVLTDCGDYYLNVLIRRFSYIDLILADTPITDVDLVNQIRNMLPERRIHIRFDRVSRFLDYLKKMEEREQELNPEYRLSSFGKHRFASKMLSSFQREKSYITEKIREKTIAVEDYFENETI